MDFAGGPSWTITHWRGIPIRLHWTLPLGAIYFGGRNPGAWLGFALLILIHELGHALVVQFFRLRVVGIVVAGFGGTCHWSGNASARQIGFIAWGGVAAQAVLWIATTVAVLVLGLPRTPTWYALYAMFTTTNLWVIGLNLLPIPPLDGAKAWGLLGILYRNYRGLDSIRQAHHDTSRPPPEEAKVASTKEAPDAERKEAQFQKVLKGLLNADAPPPSYEDEDDDVPKA